MALAGDEHDVALLSGVQGMMDRGSAVELDGVARSRGLETGFDLGKNGQRIFAAWIVAGGDDEITSLTRSFSHSRPLGTVAVSAAAEERDNTTARLLRHLPCKGGEIAQSVVGVRVVHNHREGLPRIDRLEAAGNGTERRRRCNKLVERDAARVCCGESSKKIEDVDLTGEARSELCRTGRCFEINDGATGSKRDILGAPVSFADAVGANLRASLARCGGDLIAVWIMGIEDSNTRG